MIRRNIYRILDYIFPLAEPLSKMDQDRPQKRLREDKAALPVREELLNEFVLASRELLDEEQKRKESVEARLTSILGMSSIAGTVGLAGLFLGSSGLSHAPRPLRWLITALGCYLILQICAAMFAAVRGLSRREYNHFGLSDLVPTFEESRSAFLQRKTECTLEVLSDHEAQNNKKVTQLAIAHRALMNFLGGLLMFAVISAIFVTTVDSSDELIDRIKRNPDLQKLLRGPQGPPGSPGPKGDAAPPPCIPPAGPKGRTCCVICKPPEPTAAPANSERSHRRE